MDSESGSISISIEFFEAVRSMDDWLSAPISQMAPQARRSHWLESQMDAMFRELHESPTFAAALMQYPEMLAVPISLMDLRKEKDPAKRRDGFYENRRIALHYGAPRESLYFSLPQRTGGDATHEYRHSAQSFEERLNVKVRRRMKNYIGAEFSLEADACAFQITVAWELKERGITNSHWHHAARKFPDLTRAMEHSLARDPDGLRTGSAQNDIFLAWFQDSQRVNYYAEKVLQDKLERMKREFLSMLMPANAMLEFASDDFEEGVNTATFIEGQEPSCLRLRGCGVRPDPLKPADQPCGSGQGTSSRRNFLMPYTDQNGEICDRPDYIAAASLPQSSAYYFLSIDPDVMRRAREMEMLLYRHLRIMGHAPSPPQY